MTEAALYSSGVHHCTDGDCSGRDGWTGQVCWAIKDGLRAIEDGLRQGGKYNITVIH